MRITNICFEASVRMHDGESRVGCSMAIDADEEAAAAMAAAKRFVGNELANRGSDGLNECAVKAGVAERLRKLADQAEEDAVPF